MHPIIIILTSIQKRSKDAWVQVPPRILLHRYRGTCSTSALLQIECKSQVQKPSTTRNVNSEMQWHGHTLYVCI